MARADGDAVRAVPAAIESLRKAQAGVLPRRATLTVPDEQVYYMMIPATSRWRERHDAAAHHFAEALGRADLVVQSSLVASGRAWLAAAVEESDHAGWGAACEAAGLEIEHVHPALLCDLRRLAAAVPERCLLVIVRIEGAMLLDVRDGAVFALQWERCGPADLEQRVTAFARANAHGDEAAAPVVYFHGDDIDALALKRIAAAHGWTRLQATTHVEETEA